MRPSVFTSKFDGFTGRVGVWMLHNDGRAASLGRRGGHLDVAVDDLAPVLPYVQRMVMWGGMNESWTDTGGAS